MSIPRVAIARPVTMFMISGIIILLGGISAHPTAGRPAARRHLSDGQCHRRISRRRPAGDRAAAHAADRAGGGAVAGLEQINSSSQEGSSRGPLSFAWGTDLSEAMDDLRTRLDRVRGRLPLEAEALTIFRQDSNAMPIMSLGIEGNYDRVTLREMAENQIGPRLERVNGVAAVTTNGGLRRQIHVELSKEKIAALELPVERVSALLRSENQNTPLGEVNQGERTYLLRSQSQFQSLDEIRNLVLMTRNGVPIYIRDVAEVEGHDRRRPFAASHQRPPGRAPVGAEAVRHQYRAGLRWRPGRDRPHQPGDAEHQAERPRRQRDLHQPIDPFRAGARAARRRARHAHYLLLPAKLPIDAHRLHVDSDFGGRHLRPALLQRTTR